MEKTFVMKANARQKLLVETIINEAIEKIERRKKIAPESEQWELSKKQETLRKLSFKEDWGL